MSRIPCKQCGQKFYIILTQNDVELLRVVTRSITQTNEVDLDIVREQAENNPDTETWFSIWTAEDLLEKQKADPIIRKVIEWKESNIKPRWKDIVCEGT